MRKKWIIGAGIVLSIFVLFLIFLSGGTTSKTVKTEELETIITGVTCEVKDENEKINYDIDLLSNDVSFDTDLQKKNYSKVIINHEKTFKSIGLAFAVKSSENSELQMALYRNNELLKTDIVEIESDKISTANLALDSSVEIKSTDTFYVVFNQENDIDFTFDTLLFFIDEE